MDWYPQLREATMGQLKDYSFICRGPGIEWSGLDYHLSIESMLALQHHDMARGLRDRNARG